MSQVNDRLADYAEQPWIHCTDPRWEGVLTDMHDGYIHLSLSHVKDQYLTVARIVPVNH